MSRNNTVWSRSRWQLLFAAFTVFALVLWGCGGGGDSSSSGVAGGGGTVVVVVPPATFPITAFAADVVPGNIVVTSANTLAVGDVILVTGTTNYNGTFTVVSANAASFTITAAFVANDAAGFWQLAGGLIAGCATTGATGSITLANPAVSRFNGVAPLAVFFDASGTATVPATPRPFHDLGYGWNFGDSGPSAGPWATGSRPGVSSRNSATGPMAAHVYETAGTYDVTLIITDGANTVTNACVRIAVQDPEVIFAGANTICFSTSGTPCSNPGAVQVTTSNFSTAMAMAAPGTRLLFRRGEIWTAPGGAAVPRLSANGPGIVGAFGAGAAPLVQPTAPPGNTILAISGPTTPNITDWRIMDLEFDGLGGLNSNGVVGAGGAHQITFLRMRMHDISNGFNIARTILDILNGCPFPSVPAAILPAVTVPIPCPAVPPGGHLLYDQIAIVDSNTQRVLGSGGNHMFLEARRLSVLGNFGEVTTDPVNGDGEHILRVQYVSKGVIQANDFGLPAVNKTVFTLRAVNNGQLGVTSPNNTDQVVISDNLFRGGLAAQPISIQPSGGTEDQRIGNIIFDGNVVRGGPSLQTAIVSAADEITVRNNIFDVTGATAFNCITHQQLGAEPAHSEIRIFNNTCFTNSAGGGALRLVFLGGNANIPPVPLLPAAPAKCGQQNVTIRNNLGFAPNLTGSSVLLFESSPCATTAGLVGGSGIEGNSSNAQIKLTSPLFSNGSGTFSLTTDFTVGGGSYAVNGGVPVPVFSDLFRTLRPQAAVFDIGAAEQ